MAPLALFAVYAGLLTSELGLRAAHAGVGAGHVRTSALAMHVGLDRRAMLSAALFAGVSVALPDPVSAKIDSVNPANNYYFPQVCILSRGSFVCAHNALSPPARHQCSPARRAPPESEQPSPCTAAD